MRVLALVLLAGCSFRPGALGRDGGATDGAGSGSDGKGSGSACTAHTLPPALNVDPATWSASFLTAPVWTCTAIGTTTIDSASGAVTSDSCAIGTPDITNNVMQLAGGPPVMVVRLRGLTLTGNHVLRLTGDKPIVLLVAGDVAVDGGAMIDAGARAQVPGPGGSLASVCTNKASGLGMPGNGDGWGGGGGGFGTPGGQGGYNVINGGLASGTAMLVPLRGGCSGGTGNTAPQSGQFAGGGGGAFEISASGTLAIGMTGVANVSAGGGGAPAFSGGGNGGGSGGAILLAAPAAVMFGALGTLRAHGGSGSSGSSSGGNLAGGDGHSTDNSQATDTSTIAGGGNNNDHGRAGGLAYIAAGAAPVTHDGDLPTQQTGGRGGGGGGGGRVVVTTAAAAAACD